MSLTSIERCPRCGSPYMSAMLPNETPATRYCYTCATAAGGLKQTLENVSENNPDDLELQPTDTTLSASSHARRGIPQIAPGRSGARNIRPPTAVPNIRPSARGTATPNAMPVSGTSGVPQHAPSGIHQAAASGSRNRISAARAEIPQIAPRAENFQTPKSNALAMKIGIGLCACVLVALLAAYGLKGGKPQPAPEAPVASVVVQPTTAPKLQVPATPSAPAVPAIKKPDPKLTEKKVDTAPIKSESVKDNVGFVGTESPAPAFLKPAAPATPGTPTPVETKPVVKTPETVLSDVISKPKYSKAAAAADEEELAANTPVKSKQPETPVQPAETKPVPEAVKQDVAAPDADKKDDDDGLDKNGNPKKPKKSLVDNLFGGPEKPVKHEIEKKENPFAPKIIAVTVTEPMIMAFDLEKVGGNDRTMTEQMAGFLPNWRVRDANFKASKFAETHQGRDNVVVLNPLNDVLPAKLIATFEIPKSFATAKPMLRFEVSNNNGKDWGLTVKAGGIDVIPFTKIKTSKDVPWFDVPVDLSRFADKHFDVSIEVNATTKHPKGTAPELGYIRNIRFEWVGKKEGQGLQKQAPPPDAGAGAGAQQLPELPPPPSIVPRK